MINAILTRMSADKRGSAAVEFALCVPVLLLFMGGVIEYERAFYFRTELDQALRSGMQYALKAPTDLSGIRSVTAQSMSLPITVAQPVTSCRCYDGSATACTATCAVPGLMRSYVTMEASYSYAPILPGTIGGLLPGSPLDAVLAVRTQ